MLDDFDEGGCAARAPFVLMVHGDQMEPEFKDGAIIVIDPALPYTNGAYVVAQYQGETWFRQFVLRETHAWLVATNDNYEDIKLEGDFEVKGVVTQQARNRKLGIKKAIHYVK